MISLALLISGASITAQSLDDYLIQAGQHNAGLKALFSDYMAALEKVPQAKSLPDPVMAFGYFLSPVETRIGPQEFRISASQMFPWFGELKAREQAAAYMAKAKYEAFIDARNKLYFDVKKLYYQLFYLEESIRTTDENIVLVRSMQDLARIKFESGKAPMVDVLRADLEINKLNERLAFFEDTRKPLEAAFKEKLNDSSLILLWPDTLTSASWLLDKEAARDSIRNANPRLKALGEQEKAWGYQHEAAIKAGYPSINLGIDYINVGQRTDLNPAGNGRDAFLPKIGFTLPIYRNKYRAMQQETVLMQQSVVQQKVEIQNRLDTELETAERDLQDAERRISLYRDQLVIAKQALSILISAYSSAGSDFEEVLRMDRMLLNYELQLAKATTDQNTAVANLKYLIQH